MSPQTGRSQVVRVPTGGTGGSPFTAFGATLILFDADLIPPSTADFEIDFNDYILDAGSEADFGYVTWSGTGWVITIPTGKTGLYLLTAGMDMYSRSTDTQLRPWEMAVYKNGSDVIAFNQVVVRADVQYDIQPQVSRPVYLEEGDVLTVKVNGPADGPSGATDPGYGVIGFDAGGPVGVTFLSVAWMGSVDPLDVLAP